MKEVNGERVILNRHADDGIIIGKSGEKDGLRNKTLERLGEHVLLKISGELHPG